MFNSLDRIKNEINIASVLNYSIEGFINPKPTIELNMLIWQINYYSVFETN